MATKNHDALKSIALQWLYTEKHCKWVAFELKYGKYIYDVVGCNGSQTFIVEAKQSAKDFQKDNNDPEVIKQNIEKYRQEIKDTGDIDIKKKIAKERKKSSKFFDKGIFKLATECYIITPSDLVKDIPPGWGLLDEFMHTKIKAEKRAIDKKWIFKIIAEIGKKYTKTYLTSQCGVEFKGRSVIFPAVGLI
jgi:hypothetical protein